MVTIVRPEQALTQSRVKIDPSLAVGSGAGAISTTIGRQGQQQKETRVGALSQKIGDIVSDEGKKYFEQSKLAHQTGILSNAMAESTLSFKKAQIAREGQIVDKDGNPMFMTLSDDIGKIGKGIIDDVSSKLIDREVIDKFRNDFGNFVSNQQVLSLNKARRQQINYSRSSLDRGLGSLLTQGISDDINNVGSYQGPAQQLLNDSLQGGVISHDEYNRMSNDFTSAIKEGTIQHTIDTDTARAQEILKNSSEELGITDQKRNDLIKGLEAKVRSDTVLAAKLLSTAELDAENKKGLLAQDLEMRIQADALREDELLKQKDNLNPEAYAHLVSEYNKGIKKKAKKEMQLHLVTNAISKGLPTAKFKPSLVDEHFEKLVKAQDAILGKPSTLPEKAAIAVAYSGKVKSFARELNNSISSGSNKKLAEAVSAYTYVRDRDSTALDGNIFTREAEEIAEYAELLNERAGLELEDAAQIAKERITSADNIIREARTKEFKKVKEFKVASLVETAADDLGAENFFGVNKAITQDTAILYKKLVGDSYASTGDLDAAKKIASSQVNKTHGISEMNPVDIYMFAPPEKMFPNTSPVKMRAQLEADIVHMLPESVGANTVQIFSDDITKGNFINVRREGSGEMDKIELISYGIQYQKKVEGTELEVTVPLINPETGELVRWFPDTHRIAEEGAGLAIQKAAEEDVKGRGKSSAEKTLERMADEPGIV